MLTGNLPSSPVKISRFLLALVCLLCGEEGK
jgi:hypothetical protein